MIVLYWLLEYGKVFLAYIVIMFVFPSVVFQEYLSGRSKTFRFSFCAVLQPILVSSVVLSLGLMHLLYPFVVRLIFYGTFFYCMIRRHPVNKKALQKVHYMANGSYRVKTFMRDVVDFIRASVRKGFRNLGHIMRGHWWEYGLLAVVVLYGMIYFSYGAFQDYSYGFGDMYPHNAWIYGLLQGKPFSAGVYPEGMHCFLYAMHVLFGVRVYSCLLFTAGIHMMVFLLSAYILLREVFHWRYSPLLVLTAFLTLEGVCINEIYAMCRLQWTIPQEFGFYTLFICAAFLVKYVREAGRIPKRKWKKRKISGDEIEENREDTGEPELTKCYWDENLVIFMLALAGSLIIHFYVTIMAFFLCVSFALVAIGKILNYRRFVPLVAAVVCGCFIAILPMAGALASGIPFQGSIGWAMNVMNGTDAETYGEEEAAKNREKETEETDIDATEEDSNISQEEGQAGEQQTPVRGMARPLTQEEQSEPVEIPEISFQQRLRELTERMAEKIKQKANTIYYEGYVILYRKENADIMLLSTALAFALWIVFRLPASLLKLLLRKRKKVAADYLDQYCAVALSSVFYMIIYCAYSLGLPALIAGSRLCAIEQILLLATMIIPVDLIFTIISLIMFKWVMKIVALFCVIGIYVGTIVTGRFHGYLYYEFTRYNGAVITTDTIMRRLPEETYTIVSPVDELYHVIQYGYHEEAINFVNKSREGDYTLPTPYVFIYVEKKPLKYAQSHFFAGPKWLAWEKYPAFYNGFYASQCPDIMASEISEETAQIMQGKFPDSSQIYTNLETRTAVESRLYAWCREFERLYPGELKTYYEDDAFVCYYFKQNPQRLYQLAIQ